MGSPSQGGCPVPGAPPPGPNQLLKAQLLGSSFGARISTCEFGGTQILRPQQGPTEPPGHSLPP